MAGLPLEFHPEAEAEYLTSLDWYRGRSLNAATNLEREFLQAINKIESAPQRWPRYVLTSQRNVLHRFPFSIVYRAFPTRILVVAVAHAHRRPGYWAGRIR